MRELAICELDYVFGGNGPTGQPGDGYWQADVYNYYSQQADLFDAYAAGAIGLGSLAAALGAISAPSGVGGIVGGLTAVAAGLTAALAQHLADQARDQMINEMMDRVKQIERDTQQQQVDP